MTEQDYKELDGAFESIFEIAMEEHTISPEVRKKLPDDCFGIIEEEDGKVKRAYPLVVPGDKEKTKELISKSVMMFHYCKPERRETLAKNILKAIKTYKVPVEMSAGNQILKYIDRNDLPKCVTIVPRKTRSSKEGL